jgi:hypothetical protein
MKSEMIFPSLVTHGVTTHFQPIMFLANQYLCNFIREKRIGESYIFIVFNISADEN